MKLKKDEYDQNYKKNRIVENLLQITDIFHIDYVSNVTVCFFNQAILYRSLIYENIK